MYIPAASFSAILSKRGDTPRSRCRWCCELTDASIVSNTPRECPTLHCRESYVFCSKQFLENRLNLILESTSLKCEVENWQRCAPEATMGASSCRIVLTCYPSYSRESKSTLGSSPSTIIIFGTWSRGVGNSRNLMSKVQFWKVRSWCQNHSVDTKIQGLMSEILCAHPTLRLRRFPIPKKRQLFLFPRKCWR